MDEELLHQASNEMQSGRPYNEVVSTLLARNNNQQTIQRGKSID